ncbi:MAG: hypothetical protein ABIS15_06215 [Gemmatimonadaceae bacterium]
MLYRISYMGVGGTMPEATQVLASGSARSTSGPLPRTLGAVALLDGIFALTVVVLGSPSWILLGSLLVVWIVCGWAIYFRPRPRQPLIAALGSVLLWSAALVALAVLTGVYLLALGPSWIL